jgi:hypothetical protein
MNKKQVSLMVTTAHKGVFFGYGTPTHEPTIELSQARMCVYWSSDMKGVMGLAVQGPSSSCKIGPAVPKIILRDVTAVIEVSDQARAKWESQPWN